MLTRSLVNKWPQRNQQILTSSSLPEEVYWNSSLRQPRIPHWASRLPSASTLECWGLNSGPCPNWLITSSKVLSSRSLACNLPHSIKCWTHCYTVRSFRVFSYSSHHLNLLAIRTTHWHPSSHVKRKKDLHTLWLPRVLFFLVVLFFVVVVVLFVFFFQDRVSLYSPGCPGTHFVDQAGLKNLPASASRVLGLKVCATTAQRW